jgi:hypothetical protein
VHMSPAPLLFALAAFHLVIAPIIYVAIWTSVPAKGSQYARHIVVHRVYICCQLLLFFPWTSSKIRLFQNQNIDSLESLAAFSRLYMNVVSVFIFASNGDLQRYMFFVRVQNVEITSTRSAMLWNSKSNVQTYIQCLMPKRTIACLHVF